MSGVGRPAGPDAATIQLGREMYALHNDWGVRIEKIAERYGKSRAWAYALVGVGRDHPAPDPSSAAPQDPTYQPDSDSPPESRPPRRVPLNTALRRMFDAKRTDRVVQLLTPDLREFWTEVVADIIQRSDDGVELAFGTKGRVYPTQGRFLDAFRRPAADLEALFYDGLLVDLDGAGIAMPHGYGLRPKPPKATAAGRTGPRRSGGGPDPRQGHILYALPGGRRDDAGRRISPDIFPDSAGIFPDSAGISPDIFPDSAGIFLDSAGLPHAAAAAALDKVNQSFSSSGSSPTGSPGESREIRISPDENLVKLPISLDSISQDSALATLTTELAALAGIAGPPDADDQDYVRRWLAAGISPDTMRAVVRDKAPRAKTPIKWLSYFRSAMVELDARPAAAPQTAPSPPVALALSAEDRAIAAMIEPMRAAWRADHSCPVAPSVESWKAAFDAGGATSDLAAQWIDAWIQWDARARHWSLKPPDFTWMVQQRSAFEERMRDVEAELADMIRAAAD